MYFSIVIPTYNRRAEIERCLDSISRQSLQDYEVIVVDDGSTDDTAEYLISLLGHTTCICQKNSGPSRARNAGLAIAKGRYVIFLDSDDELLPHCLADFYAASYPTFPAIVSGNVTTVPSDVSQSQQISTTYWSSFSDYVRQNVSYEYPFPSATIVRTDLARKVRGFPNTRSYAEDLDFWIRLAEEAGYMKINGTPQAIRNMHVNQLSHQDGPITSGLLRIAIKSAFKRPRLSLAMQTLVYEGLVRHRNWVRGKNKYLSTLILSISMLMFRSAWVTPQSGRDTV